MTTANVTTSHDHPSRDQIRTSPPVARRNVSMSSFQVATFLNLFVMSWAERLRRNIRNHVKWWRWNTNLRGISAARTRFPSRACCFSRMLVFVSRLATRSLVYVCNFADLSLGLLFWAVSYFHIDKSCTVFSSNKSHNTPHSSLAHFLHSSRTLQGRTGYGLFFPIIVIIHHERHFMFIHSTLLYLSLDGVIPEAFIYLCICNIMVAARIDA
ncbi:hypothetical protein BC827DRAFT_1196250 [Russula dissimulans]|nr:hypothetical protein BC827DRAFT_1196250 [Russula dissimulans]